MRKTLFAGLTALDPGEPISTDGYSFTSRNIDTIDHMLEVGAVTHRHDAHAALGNPAVAPSAFASAGGGTLPADTALWIGYTLLDEENGETTLAPVVTMNTRGVIEAPVDGPSAHVDYTAGVLRADTYYYAITFTDGAGGETTAGPSVSVEREPGSPSAQVIIEGLDALVANASAAGWRLYRATGGGQLDFLTEGTSDSFTDDGGVACNCNVRPPTRNRTNQTNRIGVVVPSAAASGFNLYVSEDGSFISPCLYGTYPMASAGQTIQITQLLADDGAPPDVSTALPGASKIDPDTELIDWHWKRPVASASQLGAGEAGDVRAVRESGTIYVVRGSAAAVPADWAPVAGQDLTVRAPGGEFLTDLLEFEGAGVTITEAGPGHSIVTIAGGGGGGGGGSSASGSLREVSVPGDAILDPEAIQFVGSSGTLITLEQTGASAVVTIAASAVKGDQGDIGPAGSGDVHVYGPSASYGAPNGIRFVPGDGIDLTVTQDLGEPGVGIVTILNTRTGGGGGGTDPGSGSASAATPGGLTEWQPLALGAGWSNLNAAASGEAVVAKDLNTGLIYVRAPLARAAGAATKIAQLPSGADTTGNYYPEVAHAYINEQGIGVEVLPDGAINTTGIDDAIEQVVLSMLIFRGTAVDGAGGRGATLKAEVSGGGATGVQALATDVFDPFNLGDGTGLHITESGRYMLRAFARTGSPGATISITRGGAALIEDERLADHTLNVGVEAELVQGDQIRVEIAGQAATAGSVHLSATKLEGSAGQAGAGGSAGPAGAVGPQGAQGDKGDPGDPAALVRDTVTINAGLASGGAVVGDAALGELATLTRLESTSPVRLRLYATDAHRDADVARPVDTDVDIGTDHGLLMEFVGSPTLLDCRMAPPVRVYDGKDAPDGQVAYHLQNLGASAAVAVGLTRYPV